MESNPVKKIGTGDYLTHSLVLTHGLVLILFALDPTNV